MKFLGFSKCLGYVASADRYLIKVLLEESGISWRKKYSLKSLSDLAT